MRAGEVIAAKPQDLSSIPGSQAVEGERPLRERDHSRKLTSDLHVCPLTSTCAHTCIHHTDAQTQMTK